MKSVLLADNQDITRAGLLYICKEIAGYTSLYQVNDKKELIRYLSDDEHAIVILDYTLFDFGSADELIVLQERFKSVHWILFSEELSSDLVRRLVFSSEAFSIVLKDLPLEEIQAALQCAGRGERFLCHRTANLLLSRKNESDHPERPLLTVTELEILKAIAQGKTTKEIAAGRFSSIHTIMTHRKNIFRKIGVNNVYEATKYAVRAGIVDMSDYYI
ncbi:MAG: response regulator transcription factor [Tannerellaceae bacterium]|nr:response regulator transcription factor [Tannerellaceae bacterium]